VIGFFSGMFLIALIDKLVPSYENPHEIQTLDSIQLLKLEIQILDTQKLEIITLPLNQKSKQC
jgi:ZIP family zinc transporter